MIIFTGFKGAESPTITLRVREADDMDPAPIGLAQWEEIGNLLTNLWIMVAFIVFFAANMILGHNLIPTLVASGHIERSWQKARIAFYTVAIISFVLAMVFLARTVDNSGVLRDFWENYWI